MAIEKETLSFWERLMKFKEKYGYWKMTKIVLFVAFAIMILFLAKNFGENFTFERQKEIVHEVMQEQNEQNYVAHQEQMELRKEIRPVVVNLLQYTLNTMGADRAFVIELHNGSNNTAGLPFLHCTMTYEETARGIESIDEDYQNISLTRFNFPEYLHEHDLWVGTIEEFEKIDPKIASRLKTNGVTYLVLTTIRSEECEIGYFGFSYCNGKEHKTNKKMMEFMVFAVQKLSKWLDNGISQEEQQ